MVASIGSNGNQSPLRYIDKSTKEKEKSLNRLASGKNNALDNPAAASIVAELEAQGKELNQASRNIGDAASMTAIAESAISGINESIGRIKELAIQASNGTYSAAQREAMQAEASQLAQEVNRTLESAQFNGQKIFDNKENPELSVQVGTDSNPNSRVSFKFGDIAEKAKGLLTVDLTTAAGRDAALSQTDALTQELNARRGELGAFQARLETADEAAKKAAETSQAAAAAIRDIDYAQETARYTANNILAQTSTAMAAHANLSQQAVMRLLS